MKHQRAWIYLLCWLTMMMPSIVFSQSDSLNNKDEADDQIQQNIEFLSEQMQSEDGDLSSLTDVWNHFRTHPINLNKTTAEELQNLQLLNDIQINHLLKHIEKNGKLISIYELQSIEGFDLMTIKKILPFITIRDLFNESHFNFNDIFLHGQHQIISRFQRVIEHQSGYFKPDSLTATKSPNSFYLGDPNRILARYRFNFRQNVSLSFGADKDPGEEFFKGTQKQGFDFYSGHIAIRNIRFIKCLTIGDYQATFGQGLVLWNGFAFGKSASLMSIKRFGMGIKPYYSFDENRFFRGIAGTLKFKKLEVTGLVSYKKLDANATITDTLNNGEIDVVGVSSLETGGLHNTNSLIQDKGAISQTVIGGNIAYHQRNFHIGITAQHMSLSAALKSTSQLYNQYDFQGQQNFNSGVDYNYVFRNMNLFGDASISQNGGKAFVQGAILALDPRLTFSGHFRYFERNYQNLFGNAISENTLPQNEQGLYLGMEAKLNPAFTLSAFIDQYQFFWLKYGVSAPSKGKDIFSQLNYTPNKKTDLYIRYRHREKAENNSLLNPYEYITPYAQENIRFNLSLALSNFIKLKSRIEYVHVSKKEDSKDNGIALFQDFILKPKTWPLVFTIRYAMFDTKSYDSRIYAYENDVLYSYSVPALYNKGQRYYIMLNWEINKQIEIWVRFSQTAYDNIQVISAGSLTEIKGSKKSEVKIQLKVRL